MSCDHSVTKPTRRVIASGVTTVALQCQRCGSGRAVKMTGYNVAVLPEFDASISVRYQEQCQKEWRERQAMFACEQATKSGAWWQNYTAYLRSDHWRSVRRRVISRDSICQVCFHLSASQAHHLTYESFNKYGISFSVECVGVCENCHEILHQKGQP